VKLQIKLKTAAFDKRLQSSR